MIGAVHGKYGIFEFFLHDTYVGHSLETLGEYSEVELSLLKQLCAPGDLVVEVGANIGALSVPLAQHLRGEGGRLVCFEPQRAARNLLRANLRRNVGIEDGTWEVHDLALGESAGSARIPEPAYSKPGNFGAVELGQGDAVVQVRTLDSFELQSLRLLKIDVEGCEASVLRGARETIARCRPLIYVENDRAQHSAELIGLLFDLGYRCWWHLPPLYQTNNARACGINPWPGVVSVNMLCAPRDVSVDIPLLEVTGVDADWHQAAGYDTTHGVEPGQKTVGVVRLGVYGDALWASSILPHLKDQGYHVTVYTELHGGDVLKHDPHIDRLVVHDPRQLHGEGYWAGEASKFDRWINLSESVEGTLIAVPSKPSFKWPVDARRARMGVNYLEHIHAVAEVPFEPRLKFYPSTAEIDRALGLELSMRARGASAVIAIAPSGSTWPKWYPHLPELLREISAAGFGAYVLGDLRGAQLPQLDRVVVLGTTLAIRDAIALMQVADLCIGQETGLINAVSFEPMPKVVLLSHSSNENLTRDWVATTALHGTPACYPCHQIHFDRATCTVDANTGAAACQSSISVDQVMAELHMRLALSRLRNDMERAA